jgi:glutamate formiminotransferase / 5-formyltetrahydrofolate cyclo-ligase
VSAAGCCDDVESAAPSLSEGQTPPTEVPSPSALAECVVNISEGRDRSIVDAVASAAGDALLDVHVDGDHHRSVLTLGGSLDHVEAAARRVVTAAVDLIDLGTHTGVHPRLGAADVVPFVLLPRAGSADPVDPQWSVSARDRFAGWAGDALSLPCFLYGPLRSLPEVRRSAFTSIAPDTGPAEPHPTAGATAVGARPVLIAYNVWIDGPVDAGPDQGRHQALSAARSVAAEIRGPALRTLGLPVVDGAQVSCNLVDVASVSVVDVYDQVAVAVEHHGCSVRRAELVGLLPDAQLRAVPRRRWVELDLAEDRTIEARLAERAPG